MNGPSDSQEENPRAGTREEDLLERRGKRPRLMPQEVKVDFYLDNLQANVGVLLEEPRPLTWFNFMSLKRNVFSINVYRSIRRLFEDELSLNPRFVYLMSPSNYVGYSFVFSEDGIPDVDFQLCTLTVGKRKGENDAEIISVLHNRIRSIFDLTKDSHKHHSVEETERYNRLVYFVLHNLNVTSYPLYVTRYREVTVSFRLLILDPLLDQCFEHVMGYAKKHPVIRKE